MSLLRLTFEMEVGSMTFELCVPTMVVIPGGKFTMGESPNDKFANDTERPAHLVTVEPFAISDFPVTVDEYGEFRPGTDPDEEPALPMVNVSWVDAKAYCAFLSRRTGKTYRLPSEAEWEFVCRAGTSSAYPFGDQLSPEMTNYLYDESGNRIGLGCRSPRGAFPENALGLFDLCGNVCEWCEDTWHPFYAEAPVDGSAWIDGGAPDRRVIRGGAWDYLPRLLRSSWRDWMDARQRRDNVGFRIAMTLEE